MKKFMAFLLACTVLLCFAVPAYAVEYEESPGRKITIEGNETLMLVTTPIECIDEALHVEIMAMLASARGQIAAVGDLSELCPGISGALERTKAESSDPRVKALTVKDLVIIDLFDVSLIKNKTEFIHSEPGQTLTFSVKTDLRPGDIYFVMHNYEGNNWEMLSRTDLSDDGVLLVAVDSLSPMAIAAPRYREKKTVTAEAAGEPVSPQTDERSADAALYYMGILGIAALFLACGAVYSRKRRLF